MTEELKTDFCIAGAGIANILLASKLAASGKNILILDQGPRFTEQDRANMLARSKETLNDFADYNDHTDPAAVTPLSSAKASADDQIVEWLNYRLFGIGGSALHFEGIMMRPLENDMRVKTLFDYGRDWPMSYSELEPWLLRAEREVGVVGNDDNPYSSSRSGPFPMSAHPFSYFDKEIFGPALNRLGIKGHSCPRGINSELYRKRSSCVACRSCKFCPSGARYSPDRVHVPILDSHPNVTILENMSLRRLETGAKGKRIVAAHFTRVKERTPVVVRAKNFILGMGGVETPRMLLLSADGSAHSAGLGNRGGQLGRGFSDHISSFATYDAGRPVGSRLGYETMISEHFRSNGDRRENPSFFMLAAPVIDWIPVGGEAVKWNTKDGVLSIKNLQESIPRIATIWTMSELEGQGKLELDDSKVDAFGSPIAKITLKLTDWDRRSSTQFAELAPKIGETMGAVRVSEIPPPDWGLGYHPSGATAMGKTPDDGVCDSNLKVFGLENLHVIGNSVFPHMGPNPPTLTIAALALRLAAHLGRRSA